MEILLTLLDKHPFFVYFLLILIFLSIFVILYSDIEFTAGKVNLKLKRKTKREKELTKLHEEIEIKKSEVDRKLYHLERMVGINDIKITSMMVGLRKSAVKDYVDKKFIEELNKDVIMIEQIELEKAKNFKEENKSALPELTQIEQFEWGTIRHYKDKFNGDGDTK